MLKECGLQDIYQSIITKEPDVSSFLGARVAVLIGLHRTRFLGYQMHRLQNSQLPSRLLTPSSLRLILSHHPASPFCGRQTHESQRRFISRPYKGSVVLISRWWKRSVPLRTDTKHHRVFWGRGDRLVRRSCCGKYWASNTMRKVE